MKWGSVLNRPRIVVFHGLVSVNCSDSESSSEMTVPLNMRQISFYGGSAYRESSVST